MTEPKDYTKLKSFMDAAITNPMHPVFQAGGNRSGVITLYALHVRSHAFTGGLGIMEAEQWFKDYPEKTAMLESLMTLCEEDLKESAQVSPSEVDTLRQQVADLTAKVGELTAKPVAPVTTPEGE